MTAHRNTAERWSDCARWLVQFVALLLGAGTAGGLGTWSWLDPGGAQQRTDLAISFQQERLRELTAERDRCDTRSEEQERLIRDLLQQGAKMPAEGD